MQSRKNRRPHPLAIKTEDDVICKIRTSVEIHRRCDIRPRFTYLTIPARARRLRYRVPPKAPNEDPDWVADVGRVGWQVFEILSGGDRVWQVYEAEVMLKDVGGGEHGLEWCEGVASNS